MPVEVGGGPALFVTGSAQTQLFVPLSDTQCCQPIGSSFQLYLRGQPFEDGFLTMP